MGSYVVVRCDGKLWTTEIAGGTFVTYIKMLQKYDFSLSLTYIGSYEYIVIFHYFDNSKYV